MPQSERGFSPLIIIIVATIVLAVVIGGSFLWQQTKSQSVASPTSPVGTKSNITTGSQETLNASITPNPSSATNSSLKITDVIQPDCTSTSCSITSVLIVTGSGFSDNTQLAATGQTNGNPYSGSLTQLGRNNNEVIFDLLNLPCQTYTATLTNPMPTGGSATFTFSPKKCN